MVARDVESSLQRAKGLSAAIAGALSSLRERSQLFFSLLPGSEGRLPFSNRQEFLEENGDEYLAVMDLTAEFYLQTVDTVFVRHALPKGEMMHRDKPVDLSAIKRCALMTVEGEKDDVCAVGQTSAAHGLCTGLRPHLKRHHLQPGICAGNARSVPRRGTQGLIRRGMM